MPSYKTSRTSTMIPRELEIPEIWGETWNEVYAAATEGVDRDIVLAQGRGAHLLKSIQDKTFSFSRLAWLCLWSRTYWLLDAARKALNARSAYTLEVLVRLSFELHMHVEVVGEKEPDDRLRAYAAWCILSDINYQKEVVHPKALDAVWNPEPARAIVENKKDLAVYEQLFGPITVDIDERRLRRGRFMQQHQEQHRLQRLKSWLSHPELSTWKLKLDESQMRQPTLFEVLNESERSVRSRLRSKNSLFLYLGYSKGSLFVHGSTLEQFISLTPNRAKLRSLEDEEECEALASFVSGTCNGAFVMLNLLQRKLWHEADADDRA